MSATPRNQDLPILDEMGHDLGVAFRREERAEAARRNRRRLRRLAVAGAALFALVPGAVATRSIWAPSPATPPGTAFETPNAVQIADGRSGAISWRLSAIQRDDGTCWQASAFTAANDVHRLTSCSADARGAPVHLTFGPVGSETFVVGWADPRVSRVVVDPGNGDAPRTARMVIAAADRAEAAMLPAGARAYVVSFPGDLVSGARPRAVAFDAAGRELGADPPRR